MGPKVCIVMGVMACGKTTVGILLSEKMNWKFADADDFHPQSNKEKMKSGVPLTDEDRIPWLQAMNDSIQKCILESTPTIFACSALKKKYRLILANNCHPEDILLIYLKIDKAIVYERVTQRKGHFITNSSLIESQFATLEEPQDDEQPLVVNISKDQESESIVNQIVRSGRFNENY